MKKRTKKPYRAKDRCAVELGRKGGRATARKRKAKATRKPAAKRKAGTRKRKSSKPSQGFFNF